MGLEPVISFQHVDKRFVFTKEKPQSVMETFIKLFSRRKGPKQSAESLWAVQDVSFDVLPGQCFGIVGRNGSGKSTILKLIARILRPNNGRMIDTGIDLSRTARINDPDEQLITGSSSPYSLPILIFEQKSIV